MTDRTWQRILITGAAGRIGTTLRFGLAGRHPRFRLLDRRQIEGVRSDEEAIVAELRDRTALARAVDGVDAMVHLAGAPDPRDFEEMFRANVRGLYDLFEAARAAGVKRIVFASTNHTYGLYPVEHGMTPTDPTRPDSFYGVTKVFGEQMLRYYWDKHGIESVSLRIGSFEDRPSQQRHLATWLSPRDTVELVDRALKQPGVGAAIVFGMSNNTRIRIRQPNWEAIGYRPADDAEAWRDRLKADGVDVDGPPQWKLHGGAYEAKDH
ncbi:MAG: NAD(P)-dependent oxidoreductase [Alphaproteobacteria bacterium]|nr:NAD(P)-dependent oxidoreductase [Alphaproteobacteria bacterium]